MTDSYNFTQKLDIYDDYITRYGYACSESGNLNDLHGIAVDVVDTGNVRIQEFGPEAVSQPDGNPMAQGTGNSSIPLILL